MIVTTWESPQDAREFAAAYRQSLKEDRAGEVSGDTVAIPGIGFATVVADRSDVTIAIGPAARLAGKLAKAR